MAKTKEQNLPFAPSESGEPHGILEGTVVGVIYQNEETGYIIFDFDVKDHVITAFGNIPFLSPGEHLSLKGEWVMNPRYGKQFKVESYEQKLPSGETAILEYLSSHTVKGVGESLAKRIVNEFGEDTFDIMENHPEWLANIPGISLKKAREIGEDFQKKTTMRAAVMFFSEYFGTTMISSIYQKWGESCVAQAKQNPYILSREIDGISFEKADNLARDLGFPLNFEARIDGGIIATLQANAQNNGHVCLPFDTLLEESATILGLETSDISPAINRLIQQEQLKYTIFEDVKYLYLSSYYDAETYVARELIDLDNACVSVSAQNIHDYIAKEEKETHMTYAPLQQRAIYDAMSSGVLVLTGGPGTGKTTIVRALVSIFTGMGMKVALTAPTGRAAKRLSESTAKDAKTIHRLLETEFTNENREETMFHRNEKYPLDEKVIIVDEMSMVDIFLMQALLKAVKPGSRLILIGDADQLPSVGPGNVLGDLIGSHRFATVRLTEIFRQAEESLIVKNAHRVNKGEMPILDCKNNDFFFLERREEDIVKTLTDLCLRRLPRAYGENILQRLQIVCPSKKGECGTETVNKAMQDVINPASEKKREFTFGTKIFREGDKVMQTRNNYEIEWIRFDHVRGLGIFNGDIGTITNLDKDAQEMEIMFDDRKVNYSFSLLGDLEHAWAITIHKSQGSEYPVVLIPMAKAPPMLMTRNLLYTAVTRAETMVILVGKKEIIETMVHNEKEALRYSGLEKRLLREETW